TEFLLYVKDSSAEEILDPEDLSTIDDSGFVKGAKTLFLIHGFSDNGKSGWIQAMKDELLKLVPVNVIIVNWKKGANGCYFSAIRNIKYTGDSTVELIGILSSEGEVPLSKFHLIGHSLGAHVAGHVGQFAENIGRITGLDPASFGFSTKGTSKRLDASDADFVDVIHTDDGALFELSFGYVPGVTVGDADFYPNGGSNQPDCPMAHFRFFQDVLRGKMAQMTKAIACSHMRAVAYFTSSINTCEFPVHTCPNGDEVPNAYMGYHASPDLHGKFCLETTGTKPFCVSNLVAS
ncbi:hypothetical protein LOTGIDRAFT_102397, partial [Lottia gigantea]